jgi:hypothetical protein
MIATPTPQVFEIPTSPQPQSFSAIFPNGVTYNLRLIFQFDSDNCWLLDISDVNSNPLVTGIPLVTGADLVAQYDYIFGGTFSLFATTDGDPAAPPTFFNLGTTGHLRVSTPAGA